MRKRFVFILAAFCTGWFCISAFGAEHPNIIFILADDIGYGDLSSYGAKHVKTPNLDRLAAQGCRFTDAHSPASTCTPTRRALLTGAYSWRQSAGSGILPGDAPLSIPAGSPTVASMLQNAGYRTGVVGKWHLGLGGKEGPDWNGDLKPGPRELGFDYSFLMPATGDRVPCVYVENQRVVGLDPADPIRVSYKNKIGDEPTGRENPDRLTLKHTHGHDATIINGIGRIGWMTGGKSARWVDEDKADLFAQKAIAFIEQNKSQRFFLYFAAHDIHVPRVPHPRFRGTSSVGIRGDVIHQLDDTVGQLLAALDRLQLSDRTLVIFTSDNGGVMDDGYEDVGKTDYSPNAPLRGGKGTLFEGGHRVPFLARWPRKIQAGTTNDALITHLDLFATFGAVAGAKLPADAAPDSFDLLPALLGQSKQGREHFVAHTGGTQGPLTLRVGSWKYIEPGRGGPAKTAPNKPPVTQLYNLADDLGETKNLAEQLPDKVAEMKTILQRLRDEGRSRK